MSKTTYNGEVFMGGSMPYTSIGSAPTVASAATISVTTPITFISGTTQIATINTTMSTIQNGGIIILIPTGTFTTATSGNIALASTAVVSKALIMIYDPTTVKWYPSY
jgi:hypothetical protein